MKKDGRPLLGAILVEKPENVIGPNIGSKIAKGVAVSRGVAVGGINLQFVRLVRLVHLCRECPARRQVKIVGSLKKEDWRGCIAHGASHERLQCGSLRPTLRAPRGIDPRTISSSFYSQHSFDAAK